MNVPPSNEIVDRAADRVLMTTEEVARAIVLMESIDSTLKAIIASQRAAAESWARRDEARMNRPVVRLGDK